MLSTTKKDYHIAMLILAAGSSSRMQDIKQLLPWKNTTLLGNAIETGINSKVDSVFVVLGANYNKIRAKVKDKNAHFIYHKNWGEGMGSTIGYGIKNILKLNNKIDAVLIALSDQPLIDVIYINNLVNRFLNSEKK